MSTLFHPSLYRFAEAQPSYWEASAGTPNLQGKKLEGDQQCDVAIIGGGYTGLSAAYHLVRDYQVDVRVLEAGHIGWGASGRNGGFCCLGSSKLSVKTQISRFGIDETRAYHRCLVDAVEMVRALGQDEAIDFLPQGDAEYGVAESRKHFAAMQSQAEFERRELGMDYHMISQGEFAERGYDAPHQHGAMVIRPGFGLHPLRYCQGLAEAAERRGAVLHPHSRVLQWRKQGDRHLLETADGTLTATRVILTGNGFMPEHLHRGIAERPLPIQSQIVVTRPMSPEELRERGWFTQNPTYNSKRMFFYYRVLSDGRFMCGGRGNHIGDPLGAGQVFTRMQREIARMWPRFADLEFTHQWRGLVCFTRTLRPSVGRMPEDPSIYFGYAYHGNGVANASWTGRALAQWLAGADSGNDLLPMHLPAIMRGRSPRFPFGFLRRQYLRLGMTYYRLLDWLDR
ncbi:MAG: FAD-binding oxidoreductase [Gammaproteobacteria bacterium]|nr:FAD-binding oxidoreductase [Gammaproteobacteria bacterium]